MLSRPRRNRRTPAIRSLCEETTLNPGQWVMPFFVLKGTGRREGNPALPGLMKMSKDQIAKEAERLHALGVPAILLFPAETSKDPEGSEALSPNGVLPETIRFLKQEIPSLCILCDVALDPYTSHGQDGLIDAEGIVLNDPTVQILEKQSLLLADFGADFVAPSDMMDGRVEAIRRSLDARGHTDVGIISYTAKYASSLYGPFREVLGSTPSLGDKKNYQMNPANIREALREASLDEAEGADALLIKPASLYLDVIAKIKEHSSLPICAYHVSGEYAMVLAAAAQGHLDAKQVFTETFISIKRAGADFLISYAIPHILGIHS